MSDEILQLITNRIDPRGCRLINRPKRIWVFGGPLRQNSNGTCESLRNSFWKQSFELPISHTARSWVVGLETPEDYQEWRFFSGYTDLLEFERDACCLARATILFAESPGSLVELGTLAIDNDLIRMLFVVVEDKYMDETSFVRLGPIERLKNKNDQSVSYVASSDISGSRELSDVDFASVIDHIGTWLPKVIAKPSFNPVDRTHALLMLADLVDLLGVSNESVLLSLATHFGLDIDSDRLQKSLALLHFFKLIIKRQRGKEFFYLRNKTSEAPWIDYKGLNGNFDRSRFKIECEELIKKNPRLNSLMGAAYVN